MDVLNWLKQMGAFQIVLSAILCTYGLMYLAKYRFAAYYHLSGTERTDKLLMAIANLSLSVVSMLSLVVLKA